MKLLYRNLNSSIYKCLKGTVLLSSIVFSVIQVDLFYDLYTQKATILGVNYQEMSNRPYPSVTFCPQEVFKNGGVPINRTEYHRLSYKMVKLPHSILCAPK